jgi:hypothetical protein
LGTSPINFGLLGGNGNTLKLEMTTKLKDKQTSIATVRDLLRTFSTFPAPLLSHYRLPLKYFKSWELNQKCKESTEKADGKPAKCERRKSGEILPTSESALFILVTVSGDRENKRQTLLSLYSYSHFAQKD